ncbi:MAG: hypothetical protein HW387_1095 [Parachlamydiales bacterium]|nr:hypothetical protein [Parachlamydiales bacterium]
MRFPQIRDYTAILNILAMALILFGCSGIEQSENEKVRRRNCKGEYIYRNHDENVIAVPPPAHLPRPPYPWEGNLPRITKEFFRCKGSPANPPIMDKSDLAALVPCTDCEGSTRHGLPILRGQQSVYPILLDLLNYVQKTTAKRVIITSGHRCPVHNKYVDPAKENQYSKHQIGAEVDFYVQDMERRPMEIIQLLMEYFRQTRPYKGVKEYEEFLRYDKPDARVTTKPWYNKEIFIKYHSPSEGRNADNRHPYPYISVQVRYDREAKERVVYDWKRANLGYPHD